MVSCLRNHAFLLGKCLKREILKGIILIANQKEKLWRQIIN